MNWGRAKHGPKILVYIYIYIYMVEEENVSHPWKVKLRAFSFKVTLKFKSGPKRQLNSLNLRETFKFKRSGIKFNEFNEFNCLFGFPALGSRVKELASSPTLDPMVPRASSAL